MAHWYESKKGQARLALEHRAMERFHPQFQLRQRKSGSLYFRGQLVTSFSGTAYTIEVEFSKSHPASAPVVRLVAPKLRERHVPHRYGDGRLCLYKPADGPGAGYASATTTGATLVGWAAAWLHAYEIWRRTKIWPGPEGH